MGAHSIEIVRNILEVVSILFVVYLLGYSTTLFFAVVSGTTELYENRRRRELRNVLPEEYYLPVSILIPAYNEKLSVLGTIYSLLDLNYKIFEIVVIDDGSTDDMSKMLIERLQMHEVHRPIRMQIDCTPAHAVYECTMRGREITLLVKKNGGKADTLNLGINASRYPYLITMDADSMLEENALTNIVAPMLEDDAVVAVGGLVRPANNLKIEKGKFVQPTMPKNLLACMQVLEYDRSFLSARLLFDRLNATLIISGAFGLFRKREMIAINGFQQNTIGEDMEVVVKLHSFCRTQNVPYRIRYVPDAVCWTQAPERIGDLVRQRRRWHIGLLQTLTRYRWLMLRPSIGVAMWGSYLYYLFYELLSPIIEILGLAATALAMVAGLVSVQFMLLFYIIYAAYGWVLTLSAFFSRVNVSGIRVTITDVFKAMIYCFFENTALRTVLLYARITAFFSYQKNKYAWNKMKRQHVDFD